MKQRIILILIAFTLGSTPGARGQQERESAAGERTGVELTIYNQNLSLVREERLMRLAKGMSLLALADIPSTIDATSVFFQSLTDPNGVRVLEQNYQYDLVHQAKLLEKYLGREVEFVRKDPETNREFTVKGKLLSTGYQTLPAYGGNTINYQYTGGTIAEIHGRIEINPEGRLVLPALPEGFIIKPQLQWLMATTREGEHRAEVSYLAGQLSWSSNYVASLSKDDAKIDLTGWVTLTNHSGTSFKNAGLKLVAGDIHVVQQQFENDVQFKRSQAVADVAVPQFTQTDLFEYKLYTLQRRTDLNQNETKQIELVSAHSVPATKIFVYDGLADSWRGWYRNHSYRSQGSFGQQSNTKVGVYVTFKNDATSGMGMPLPKGKVRVYKQDADDKQQFVGEDTIDHTPKDEPVRLYLGNAFDLVGERAQKDFKSIVSGYIVEETIEIKVRNHKDETATVQVHEHPWRWNQWEIVKSNTEWTKVDQTTLNFPVKIKKDGEAVITYTIRYSW
ncbi:MAG: DUF4139 domain-containing protein [Ignavibacteriales bacterium]|nr:DUF4139 domain-containing protein [Ignavibacteriales bacterium]